MISFELNLTIEILGLKIKNRSGNQLLLKTKIQTQKIILKEAHHDQIRLKNQYKHAQRLYREDQSK